MEQLGVWALIGSAGAIQFSIAAGQILLAVAVACWLATIVMRREPIAVPRMFWPLLVYAALTLVSAAFSPDPRTSLVDCKQLVLLLIVPMTYRLLTGPRAHTLVSVVVSLGAASAAYGIFQYAILHYDSLGQRPQGTLGHYMTYSGLLMLVIGVALARILFGRRERTWAALVMPALLVAVALTFSRNAWVGACAAAALLFSLKDFRLLAVLPVVAAIFFGIAPSKVNARFNSIFDLNDPSNRDRVAMMREGAHMIRDHPLVGVGPNMVEQLYVEYRVPERVEKREPAPPQRAAADRRRTRPAGARGVAGLHRDPVRRSGQSLLHGRAAVSRRRRARVRRRDARRRHVRVQLRRLGIPDAVPDAGDAAVRRGARSRTAKLDSN